MILIVNNRYNYLLNETINSGANFIDVYEKNYQQILTSVLQQNRNDTLIIDSEIKFNKTDRLTDTAGLKTAYDIRINPEIKFLGFIKLFGFLPLEYLLKNQYSAILNVNGSKYYRYPEINTETEEPLKVREWENIVVTLDQSIINEFRQFEHGLKNITFHPFNNLIEKREELVSFYNKLAHIENNYPIPLHLAKDFQKLKTDFKSIVSDIFDNNVTKKFTKLQKNALDLKTKFMKKN